MYVLAADDSLCVWDSAQPSHSSAVCVGVGAGSNYQSTSYTSVYTFEYLLHVPAKINHHYISSRSILYNYKFKKIFYILCLRLCLSVCSYIA